MCKDFCDLVFKEDINRLHLSCCADSFWEHETNRMTIIITNAFLGRQQITHMNALRNFASGAVIPLCYIYISCHSGTCETKSMSTQRRIYKFITDLPRMPSSGTTYFETGPRVSSLSILAFMSSTIAFNVFATSGTLDSKINTIWQLSLLWISLLSNFVNITMSMSPYLPSTLILTEIKFLSSFFYTILISYLLSLLVILSQESH